MKFFRKIYIFLQYLVLDNLQEEEYPPSPQSLIPEA
jgi:hypothetical protein